MWFETIKTAKGIRYRYSERFKTERGDIVKVSQTFPQKATRKTERAYYDLLQKKFLKKQLQRQKENPASTIKTFYDLLDTWEELTARNLKYSSLQTHRVMLHAIKRHCEDVPLSALSPRLIQNLVDTLYYTEGRSYMYANSVLRLIKQAIRYAHKEHIMSDVSDFLAVRVKKDREREAAKEIAAAQNKFLNHDELKSVLEQLQHINGNVALAMEFIALTGLRVGELMALRVMDYDREKQLIHINGTIIHTKKAGEDGQRGTPKTPYSFRDVWLNSRAMWILDTMIAKYRAYLWRKGIKADTRAAEKQFIFCTRRGYPWKMYFIGRCLNKVVLPGKHLTSHVFRHTHISMLAEKGVPLRAIMQRVGHHDPQTTLKIYTHVTHTMTEQERRIIASLSI